MKKGFLYSMLFLAMGIMPFALVSCGDDDDDSGSGSLVPSIPADGNASANPTLPDSANTVIPNLNYTIQTENGQTVIRFDLTGIQDPELKSWLRLYGTSQSQQNVWLSIDGQKKGITVHNTIDDASNNTQAAVDLVFLVDNSGSMDEEADTIAKDIIDWSANLAKTLDIRFGCVGYDVSGYVNGAFDFNTADSLSSYLNREGYTYWGTERTVGFLDETLETAAANYGRVWDECGVMALRFANDKFSFRTGANRVYVNFTDEPNQPDGEEQWSVNWVKDPANWPTTNGTVHTVFSEDSTYYSYYWEDLYDERPWLLSDYTGGTTIFAPSDFKGVSLDDLPITGALQNSYYIRVTNVENLFDGQEHTVKITILSPNGTVRAEREYKVVFTK